MHSLKQTKFLTLSLPLICFGLFLALGHGHLQAATVSTLDGWSWSANIGWVSMNGTADDASEYGVQIEDDSTLTGFAWSDAVGWIKFSELNDCPVGDCNARIDIATGELEGWARACAGTEFGDCSTMTDHEDGWDGWISLNCSNSGDCATSDYQWSISDGEITGYAWGGSVIGWLYADAIDTGLSSPVVEIGVRTVGSGDLLTTGSYTMAPGEEVEIEWGSDNTTECFSTAGGNFSTGGATDGTDDTVTEPAAGTSATYTVACNGLAGSDSVSVVVGYPVSEISIWTEPVLTEQSNTVNIFWDVTGHDPTVCSVSGPNGFNFELVTETGSQTSDPIEGETTLTISCAANGVNPAASRNVKVRVNASSFDS